MTKKLVVLEETVINSMLRNPAITREFTFLKTAAAKTAPPGKRRSCCGARKNRQNATDYGNIKAAIAALPNERKNLLKRLLSTEQIRLYFTNAANQNIKMTF